MKTKRTMILALLLSLVLTLPAVAEMSKSQQVLSVAMGQLGTPYALSSDAPNTFNCVSFVAYCFNQVASGKITSSGIDGKYVRLASPAQLKGGDIVCFKTTKQEIGIFGYHFGIYMGKGYFIHASNSAGRVVVSKIKNYKKRFVGALRVF